MEQNPSNGRTSKVRSYTFYAIGEIALVMIGILLALQVSNWNEERSNDYKAHNIAKALIVEFKTNHEQLGLLFDRRRSTDIASKTLLKIKNESNFVVTEDSLLKLLWPTYTMWTFDPINGALRSGISSGEINLLESDSLKAKLFQWEDLVNDLDEEEERLVNYGIQGRELKNQFVPTLHVLHVRFGGNLPASPYTPNYEALLANKEFESYLTNLIFEIGIISGEMKILQEEAISIIELLEMELEDD